MAVPLQHTDAQRSAARFAYESLEPLHVVAYFSPHLGPASKDAGIGWKASYVGARGGVLGPTSAAVVTSCFFNFSSAVIAAGWDEALAYGLTDVMALREKVVDQTLREALGEQIHDPDLAHVAAELREVAEAQSFLGRPLAAAWSTVPWPQEPHLALWHATAVLREWRGDGHIAALVQSGLGPVEAGIFHEATHPDPNLRKRSMGRAATMRSRGWSEDEWLAGAERLASRGLLTVGDGEESLTAAGGDLYDAIESTTDDAAVWPGVDDPESLARRARPYVKTVLDAGILPGTRRPHPEEIA